MDFIPYFFGLLTLLFLVWQFYPYFKLKRARGKHAPSLEMLLTEEQRKHSQMLLYLMSPKCGMCHNITPIVDKLATQRSDILRVDLYENMGVARELGVMATPAFVLVKNGVIEPCSPRKVATLN